MYFLNQKLSLLPKKLIILIITLNIIGLLQLYSATSYQFSPLVLKQLISFFSFGIISILISLIDLRVIYKSSYILYIISLTLLMLTYFFGQKTMGAQRWISVLGIKLQSSEIMKITVIILLSRYYHEQDSNILEKINHVFFPIIISGIPVILIIKQPDLGTAIILILTTITIFFIVGAKLNYIIYSTLFLTIISPFLWNMLHEYQKKRILIFLSPEIDPLGAGYNIIQSKIAIGSGGLIGKGYLNGSQSHLNFLPEQHTDFIFSGFAEENGLIGSMLVLIIYFLIIIECYKIAINSQSVFGKVLTIGITSMFFFHIIINISMISGILPVVGIPLVFFSYGRTILGSMLIGFGMIMNVHLNKGKNFVKINY